MRRRLGAAVAAALALSGCASPVDAPAPTLDTLQAVRRAALPPMSVGAFTASNGAPGRSLSIRAQSITAPNKGAFADMLRDTVATELRGAGRLDPNSGLVVSGALTHSAVGSGLPDGHASLGATFVLRRGGETVYEKSLRVEDTWRSSILGVSAITDAENHYVELYAKLVRTLFTDPDFRNAAAGKP